MGDARKMLPSEPAAAIDLARTGLYARNLAATARISEQPQLAELVLAASATIGPRYAARLFELATAEHVSTPGKALDALTFEVDPRTKGSDQVEAGFCFRGRRLSAEPWFPVPWPILDPPDVEQLTREARDADYEELPDARPGEEFHWHAYPPDQEAYEEFVRYALRRSQSERPARRSVAAVREWTRGRVGCADDHSVLARGPGVRPPAPATIGNHPERRDRLDESRGGLQDSARRRGTRSRMERSRFDRHRQRVPCGWARDDRRTGRVVGDTPATRVVVRHARPSHVRRHGPGTGAFWNRVIDAARGSGEGAGRRVRLAGAGVPFCEGKPFVYYSQYVPSARIHALARSHKVRLRWCPLGRLSATLLARHRFWHQLWLSDSQWRALHARLSARAETVANRRGRPSGWGIIRRSRIRVSRRGCAKMIPLQAKGQCQSLPHRRASPTRRTPDGNDTALALKGR